MGAFACIECASSDGEPYIRHRFLELQVFSMSRGVDQELKSLHVAVSALAAPYRPVGLVPIPATGTRYKI